MTGRRPSTRLAKISLNGKGKSPGKSSSEARKRFILVLGGASSGKSRYAESLAEGLGEKVVYIATGVITDEEMAGKVARHRQRRPGHWRTIESPLEADQALALTFPPGETAFGTGRVILLDGLTFFVSNLLYSRGDSVAATLVRVERLARAAQEAPAHVIVVTDEVGLGPIPTTSLGRIFRETLGEANQILARAADEVYLVIAGLAQRLK